MHSNEIKNNNPKLSINKIIHYLINFTCMVNLAQIFLTENVEEWNIIEQMDSGQNE